MKVKELIDKVNSTTNCYSIHHAEDFIKKINKVASDIYVEKHKWYNISTNIYRLKDGFVGITRPSMLKSKSTIWSDCDYMCIAKEVLKHHYEEWSIKSISSYAPLFKSTTKTITVEL